MKVIYVVAQVERPGNQGMGIWAEYAVTSRGRLLGVSEGINREVVLRLLKKKVAAGDAPKEIVVPTFFNNVRRGKRSVGK